VLKPRLLHILIFSLYCVHAIDASAQVGPNDFDVDEAIRIMEIKKGMIIGEAGAGRGFFTFPMAEEVGVKGIIYANDIKSGALLAIQNRCDRMSVTNIKTVLGEVADPKFPVNNLDMVVIVHAFHDFTKPVEWLKNLKKYMKPGASLAILDRDPKRWGRMSYHFLSRDEVIRMLKEGGFENIRVDTSLPNDNIYIVIN
jgi:ubiquinone/menaquinone biosynthesis C-methylase UbiE